MPMRPLPKPAAALAVVLLCAAPAAHAASTNVAQVVEQRNLLLTSALVTIETTIPAGTRISSHLVAISGNDAGSIAFSTPVLAVITDEQTLASTSASLGASLGQAAFNHVSLSDFALVERATFTTSGKALNYQLGGSPTEPVIVRVITAAVPEPGTWAMFIAGFGLIGAQLRRRARATRAAAQ